MSFIKNRNKMLLKKVVKKGYNSDNLTERLYLQHKVKGFVCIGNILVTTHPFKEETYEIFFQNDKNGYVCNSLSKIEIIDRLRTQTDIEIGHPEWFV